jgi:hypothetical protein
MQLGGRKDGATLELVASRICVDSGDRGFEGAIRYGLADWSINDHLPRHDATWAKRVGPSLSRTVRRAEWLVNKSLFGPSPRAARQLFWNIHQTTPVGRTEADWRNEVDNFGRNTRSVRGLKPQRLAYR